MALTAPPSGSSSAAPSVVPSSATARAWVDVDLAALVDNARTIATISGSRLMPMVKANGYGLGAVAVARALDLADPWGVGIGTVEEGAALRAAGYARPLLLMTPLLPAWIDGLLASGIRPLIGDLTALDAWTARSREPFHLEIDTGMGRSGLRWDDHAAIAALGSRLATAAWEGVATHFHSSESDSAATDRQWERFREVLAALPRRPPFVHVANSAAALCGARYAADLIRPGIFLYGGAAGAAPIPKPVAAFRTRVVALRTVAPGDTVSYGATWHADRRLVVATLAAGYADGILRAVQDSRSIPRVVELAGHVVPIVGRITMDMCMVAAPPGVAIGDVATIYGGLVSLDDQAAAAGTISYELLTAIGARVPRRYRGT